MPCLTGKATSKLGCHAAHGVGLGVHSPASSPFQHQSGCCNSNPCLYIAVSALFHTLWGDDNGVISKTTTVFDQDNPSCEQKGIGAGSSGSSAGSAGAFCSTDSPRWSSGIDIDTPQTPSYPSNASAVFMAWQLPTDLHKYKQLCWHASPGLCDAGRKLYVSMYCCLSQ